MKIAAITITYNDGFKFREWCEYYEEYKDEIDVHIIIDNASDESYLHDVESYFNDSIIIKRRNNGGCTAAYNDGIKKALEDKSIDAIMLIGNDMKLKKGSVKVLYDYLYSEKKLGMVAPLILKKDSSEIENFGISVNRMGGTSFMFLGKKISAEIPVEMFVSYVPGGMNMSKRYFYEKVGLQDENLFMYGDEIDMYYRAKKCGFIEGVTRNAIAWHQHISNRIVEGMTGRMSFLNGRNRIYLIKKHMSKFKGVCMFTGAFIKDSLVFFKYIANSQIRGEYICKCRGFYAGFVNNMNNAFLINK